MYLAGFESPDDLLQFVKVIARQLAELGFDEAAAELVDWSSTAFTTSSEFLGDLGVACKRIVERDGARVPSRLREDLDRCIEAYKEAFSL